MEEEAEAVSKRAVVLGDRRGGTVRRRTALWLLLGLPGCDSAAGPEAVVPVAVEIESGDDQVAPAGESVKVNPSVRVVGRGGGGVSGASVAFRVLEGGGSVAAQTASTGADGTASPGRWTLGAKGRQRLEATVAGIAPVVFRAGAAGVPAAVAVVAGDSQVAEVAAAVATAPVVRVTEAGGEPAPYVLVTFAVADGQVDRPQVYTGEDGLATPGRWTLGPRAGPQRLIAAVAGAGIANNPAIFQAAARPALPNGFVLRPGGGMPEIDRYYWPPPTVRVADAHGNGVPYVALGVAVAGGGTARDSVVFTDADGVAAIDRWIMGPTPGVENTLTVTILSAGAPITGASATLSAVPQSADFDIEVLHLSSPPAVLRDALDSARATWESAVNADVKGLFWQRHDVERCFSDPTAAQAVLPARFVVDDLLVFSVVSPLDGPGGAVARSGWCWAVTDEGEVWPAISVVVFDPADLAAMPLATMADVARHQLAHALGFGTPLWRTMGLLVGDANAPPGLHFTGAATKVAFESVGGGSFSDPGVPLDPLFEAEGNLHWRASVFGPELLTEFVRSGAPNPLSIVTLAAMRDAGFGLVDPTVADDYALPAPPAAARCSPDGCSAGSWRLGRRTGPAIRLGDDGLRLPRRIRDARTGAVHGAFGPARPLHRPLLGSRSEAATTAGHDPASPSR